MLCVVCLEGMTVLHGYVSSLACGRCSVFFPSKPNTSRTQSTNLDMFHKLDPKRKKVKKKKITAILNNCKWISAMLHCQTCIIRQGLKIVFVNFRKKIENRTKLFCGMQNVLYSGYPVWLLKTECYSERWCIPSTRYTSNNVTFTKAHTVNTIHQ